MLLAHSLMLGETPQASSQRTGLSRQSADWCMAQKPIGDKSGPFAGKMQGHLWAVSSQSPHVSQR